MSGTVTDPRVIVDTALGLDWQGAEGEAVPGAPFTPKQFIVCKNIGRDPDPSYIQPDGTHGSIWRRKEGTRIVSQAFKKEIEFFGSPHQLLPFLESALSGEPTTAFADLTLAGSGAGNISALSFVGIRPYHNTSEFITDPTTKAKVYIQMTDSPGFPVTVDFYRDAGLTDQVATAAVAAAATPTAITPVGSSGLSGSITLSAAATDTADATIDKVTFAWENQFSRYFRLYYTDQSEVVVLSDCVVQNLQFTSDENAELMVTASIMGKRRDIFAAETLTIPLTQLDLVTYSHSELTVTKDPTGSPLTPVLDTFSFGVENNVLQYIGNAPTPQKLIKRGFVNLGGSMQGEMADEFADLIQQARDNTAAGVGFEDLRADYTLSGRTTRFEMKNVRFRLDEPNVAEEEVEKPALDYEAHYDGSNVPVVPTVEL